MKVTVNGVDLAYTDQGSGTPIILLHAFPLSRVMWEPQMAELAQHARVIALDFRGHGESGRVTQPFSLEDLAADVEALLDHLAIPRAMFIGLSMGGYVLFAIYRRAASRIQALVLADTRAGADTPEGREGRLAMIRTAEAQGSPAIAEAMLPKLFSPPTLTDPGSVVQQIREIIIRNPVTTITADLRAMADRPDSTSLLSTIACPTLVVVGALDQGTPPADAKIMADGIRGARLVIIPDAGHLSNMEQPRRFNEAVIRFLEEVRED